jgi:TPR repeat protein
MYQNGEGVSQDYVEAMKWYRLAADQGYAKAQYKLGVMYQNGEGVSQDYAEAMKWYRLAADQGDAWAQYNLGFMYEKGQGVPQDFAEAVKWYRLAADQGDAWAQHNLGNMYHQGEGVPQDYAEAMKWLRLAADQGDAVAQYNLGLMYHRGEGVAQDYAEAIKLFRLAADQGDASAQNNLGFMYDKGQGVPQNYAEAVKWYRLAADQGEANAQNNLGSMYEKGQGVPQDDAAAASWYRKAADQGHASAQNNLKKMYARAQGGSPLAIPAAPTPLPEREVPGVFARIQPNVSRLAQTLSAAGLADIYFSVAYNIQGIHRFAAAGARFVVALGGAQHTITKENADAYFKGYSDVLAIIEQVIRQRGFRQVSGTFAMKVGPNCEGNGFRDGTVSITQTDYALKLEIDGWPAKLEGLIIEDMIAVGAADNIMPNAIGRGKAEAGRVELNFDMCVVTLAPRL